MVRNEKGAEVQQIVFMFFLVLNEQGWINRW